jgi:hypothetical protein
MDVDGNMVSSVTLQPWTSELVLLQGPLPPSIVAMPSKEVCSPDSIVLTAAPSGGTFEWTIKGPAGTETINGNKVVLKSPGEYALSVVRILGGELSAAVIDTVVIKDISTFPLWFADNDGDGFGAGAGQQFCTPPGAGWALQQGDCNDANAAINPNATEICDGIDNNCNGITDESGPISKPGDIAGPIGVCRGASNQVFSVAPVAGATSYQWIIPNGATGSSGTNSISLNFSNTYNTGMVAVRALNGCTQSTLAVLQVKYYASKPGQPGFIRGKNLGTCTGNELYSVAEVGNATSYTWVAPANTHIVSGQGTNRIELSFAPGFVSGNLSVTASNCVGTGAARTMMLRTIPAIPAAIVGPEMVCPGQTGIKFSTTGLAGVTYNWIVPTGATITNGQGTATITVTWGTVAGNVRVSAENICGVSSQRNKSVGMQICPSTITMAKAEELGLAPEESNLAVKLWPNPVRDVLMITLEEFVPNRQLELVLLQANGRVCKSQKMIPVIQGQQVRMDVSNASAGYYNLLVNQSGKTISRKVIIQR